MIVNRSAVIEYASLPRPDRVSFFREGAGAFFEVVGTEDFLDGAQAVVELEGFGLGDHFGVAQQLFDGGKEERGAVSELSGNLAGFGEALACGNDVIGESPVFGFGSVHPASGHQEFHSDMVGDTASQLDGAGVRQYADVDFWECEAGVLFHDNDVGAEHDLKSAATSYPVHRCDEGFIEVARVVQSAEATHAPVLVRLLATCCGFEIPAGREETVTGASDNRDTQLRIVAESAENVIELAARSEVDRVRFGPIQFDLEDRSVGGGLNTLGHNNSPLLRALVAYCRSTVPLARRPCAGWDTRSSETNQRVNGDSAAARRSNNYRVYVELQEAVHVGFRVACASQGDFDQRLNVGSWPATKAAQQFADGQRSEGRLDDARGEGW